MGGIRDCIPPTACLPIDLLPYSNGHTLTGVVVVSTWSAVVVRQLPGSRIIKKCSFLNARPPAGDSGQVHDVGFLTIVLNCRLDDASFAHHSFSFRRIPPFVEGNLPKGGCTAAILEIDWILFSFRIVITLARIG